MRRLSFISVLLALPLMLAVSSGELRAAQPAGTDRATHLPQTQNGNGPRVESTLVSSQMGYTLTFKQFKRSLLSAAQRRTLAANDTVLQFDIRWRHGDRRLTGLLHAYRHGTQLHLLVHQDVFLSDRVSATAFGRPAMVPFDLDGTIFNVRTDGKGFLLGTRVHVEFEAKLSGDIFGTHMSLSGNLAVRRIGV